MNNDYLNMHKPIETLETHGIPSDPNVRKQNEAQMRAQIQQQAKQAQQQAPQQQQQFQPIPPQQRVFLVNNMARPVHIPGDIPVIIDGQLAVSAQGPFKQLSRDEVDSNYLLQDYMTQPISKKKGHPLYGVPRIEEVEEQEYRRRFSDYQKKKVLREAEYAKVGTGQNHHADGSVDEVDSAFEVHTVNHNIVRAQG